MTNSIAVILVAAGSGQRCQTAEGLPKQFLMLEGEPMFVWSLRTFFGHPEVDKIVVVVVPQMIKAFEEHLERHLHDWSKKISLTEGGPTRQSSVHLGLEFLAQQKDQPRFVMIHDAARPFIGKSEIDRIVSAIDDRSGCVLALPAADTIKKVKNELVISTVDRRDLFLMQTPQAGAFTTLLTAHRHLKEKGVETTDDAAVLEQVQVPVRIVLGSAINFKITTTEDLSLAQALARQIKSKKERVGHYI